MEGDTVRVSCIRLVRGKRFKMRKMLQDVTCWDAEWEGLVQGEEGVVRRSCVGLLRGEGCSKTRTL